MNTDKGFTRELSGFTFTGLSLTLLGGRAAIDEPAREKESLLYAMGSINFLFPSRKLQDIRYAEIGQLH